MTTWKRILYLIFLIHCSLQANSQVNLNSIALNSALKVRNVQEFIDRFNFDSLGLKSLREYILARDSNIWLKINREVVISSIIEDNSGIDSCLKEDFIQQVTYAVNPGYLDYYSTNWHVIADGRFTSGDKKIYIKLFFRNEVYENRASKWVIYDIVTDRYSEKYGGDSTFFLDPMSYAIGFSNLNKILDNSSSVLNILPKDYNLRKLDMFYFDVTHKYISFKSLGKIKYYFDQIPGWRFVVEYVESKQNYSGWKITELIRSE